MTVAQRAAPRSKPAPSATIYIITKATNFAAEIYRLELAEARAWRFRGGAPMSVLVKVTLHKAPQQRISKNGNPFSIATGRESAGGEVRWWKIFAFADSARAEIDRLDEGDVVAVQGQFGAEIWNAAEGPRVSLSVTADHVLALRQPPRERKAKAAPERGAVPTASGAPTFDDGLPDDRRSR